LTADMWWPVVTYTRRMTLTRGNECIHWSRLESGPVRQNPAQRAIKLGRPGGGLADRDINTA